MDLKTLYLTIVRHIDHGGQVTFRKADSHTCLLLALRDAMRFRALVAALKSNNTDVLDALTAANPRDLNSLRHALDKAVPELEAAKWSGKSIL